MSTKLNTLQAAAAKAAADARAIAEAADNENRELTAEEKGAYSAAMAKGRDLLEQYRAAKADAAILSDARQLADEIGGTAAGDLDAQKAASDTVRRVKSLGLQIVKSQQFIDAIGGLKVGGRIPEKARIQTDPIPVKSLFTGTDRESAGVFVTPEQTGILEMLGRRSLTLREVISTRTTGSDTVEYVRQVSHVNAAAPVAEATTTAAPTAPEGGGQLVRAAGGGYKPEGSWEFRRETATVKTIAEWVPATKRALADAGQLQGLIDDELRKDIAETEENQMLRGDGEGENLPGILSTSGIQLQAFETDIFTTVRRAITKARRVGRVAPNAVGLSPEDVETVDLARENGNTGAFLGAGPFAMGPRTLWGLPIIESEAFEPGRALVGDFTKAVLWDREETTVSISDSHEDFFTRNLVAILAEERLAFGVTRPAAFVDTLVQG